MDVTLGIIIPDSKKKKYKTKNVMDSMFNYVLMSKR